MPWCSAQSLAKREASQSKGNTSGVPAKGILMLKSVKGTEDQAKEQSFGKENDHTFGSEALLYLQMFLWVQVPRTAFTGCVPSGPNGLTHSRCTDTQRLLNRCHVPSCPGKEGTKVLTTSIVISVGQVVEGDGTGARAGTGASVQCPVLGVTQWRVYIPYHGMTVSKCRTAEQVPHGPVSVQGGSAMIGDDISAGSTWSVTLWSDPLGNAMKPSQGKPSRLRIQSLFLVGRALWADQVEVAQADRLGRRQAGWSDLLSLVGPSPRICLKSSGGSRTHHDLVFNTAVADHTINKYLNLHYVLLTCNVLSCVSRNVTIISYVQFHVQNFHFDNIWPNFFVKNKDF